MYWATHNKPVPLSEIGWVNTSYLGSTSRSCDPMMVWGTTVDMEEMDSFLEEHRTQHSTFVTPAHILIRAVTESLCQHPEVNRRVIGRKVYQYENVNIAMPMLQTSTGEVDCVFMQNVEELSIPEVANYLWDAVREKATKVAQDNKRAKESSWLKNRLIHLGRNLRLSWILRMCSLGFTLGNWIRCPSIWPWQQGLNHAGAFVNYMGFSGAPPMISYKPSSLPMNSCNIAITMGPTEPRPVVIDDQVVIRKQASLFVRMDHRMINGNQAAAFISTLRTYLSEPQTLIKAKEVNTLQRAA
ncbi:MAG: 2-oxo acid dehydrogenase subunit E2 [Planctomycetes bacterium]|nr:2-oxo acid dehydrogenase subunit E2 [Planctomycetota bacterium]MCH9724891.1 2-oxo acid dehydrogenase subunit E2 [Planctomycetota bacterium]MCH9776850.1 2-oxo acid dehydrogenase subunit E2 [Planctomycetota bacterium]MCH9792221.1 2-oxo acid dehydrogenase subunit E2 [Planctomycetota bacterium]